MTVDGMHESSTRDPCVDLVDSPNLANTRPMHPQDGSTLMNLPQEIRDMIYGHVFDSLRLEFLETSSTPQDVAPQHITPRKGRPQNNSPPCGLALLLTCRRMKTEIARTWIRHVTLRFDSIRIMLDILGPLPYALRENIRHAEVAQHQMEYPAERWTISRAMKLLPGLKLDVLAVVVAYETGPSPLEECKTMLRRGHGWKELRYLAVLPENARILVEGADGKYGYGSEWLEGCVCAYKKMLGRRDGETSKPSVTVDFREYMMTNSRVWYETFPSGSRCPDPFTVDDDFSLLHEAMRGSTVRQQLSYAVSLRSSNRLRRIMIVVRRGHGADYARIEEPLKSEAEGVHAHASQMGEAPEKASQLQHGQTALVDMKKPHRPIHTSISKTSIDIQSPPLLL